jgi:hypothetical protein
LESIPISISRSARVDTLDTSHSLVDALELVEQSVSVERPLGGIPRAAPLGQELLGLVGPLTLAAVDVGDDGLQGREKVVEPFLSERSGDQLVGLPLGEFPRADPGEQFLDRATQGEC